MQKGDSPPAAREEEAGIVREGIIRILLILLTVSFRTADLIFPDILLRRLFQTFFAITVIYALFAFAHLIATRRVRESGTRYSLNRALSVLSVIVIAAVVVRIWIDTNYIFVAYGIIGAGIAVALQDLFRSFVGGILIVLYGIYTVGDRIEINEREGDVIDIGIFTTTVFEVHAHQVLGEQPTGRTRHHPERCSPDGGGDQLHQRPRLHLGRDLDPHHLRLGLGACDRDVSCDRRRGDPGEHRPRGKRDRGDRGPLLPSPKRRRALGLPDADRELDHL